MLVAKHSGVRVFDARAYLNVSHFHAAIAQRHHTAGGPPLRAVYRLTRPTTRPLQMDAIEAAGYAPRTQAAVDATRRLLGMFVSLAPVVDVGDAGSNTLSLKAWTEAPGRQLSSLPFGDPSGSRCIICLAREGVQGGLYMWRRDGASATATTELSPGFMAILDAGTAYTRTPLVGPDDGFCRVIEVTAHRALT